MATGISLMALAIQLGTAAMLALTGGLKLAQPGPIRATLEALGTPRPVLAATALGVAEIGVGMLLVLAPRNQTSAVAVLGLGLLFAAAGLLAIARRTRVGCACFGAAVAARLGWLQVALVPAWTAVAVSLLLLPAPLADQRPTLLVVLLVALAAGTLLRAAPIATEHRTLRRLMEGW